MTNEQAKSELMQIYGMLSEEKKIAIDVAVKALQAQANEINQKDILNALLEGKDEEQRKIIEDAIEKMENLGSKKQAQADGKYQTDKDCYNCGQPRDYKGRCIPYKEGNCNRYSEWMPKQTDGEYITQSAGDEIRQKNYDLISRQAVLKQLRGCLTGGETEYQYAKLHIDSIPSVKPQPCEDAVSRKALISHIENQSREWGEDYDAQQILGDIEDMPSVKPQEPTGHWIMPQQDDGMSDPIYYQVRCSKCGFDLDPQTWHMELHQYDADKYCPNCGAKMD